MDEKRKRKDVQVFYQFRYRPLTFLMSTIALGIPLVSFIFILLPFFNSFIDSRVFVTLGLILSVILSVMVNSRTRIVIHEDGIEYYNPRHIGSTWDNLSHFQVKESEDIEQRGKYFVHYLTLKDNRKKLFVDQIIPISTDSIRVDTIDFERFRKTLFGQELLNHAPHVFPPNMRGKVSSSE